jgi:diguanylate cyclase (GGDEF)-like protein/PAS domain S-box-containing protein
MKFFKYFSPNRFGTNLAFWFCLISVASTLVLAEVIEVASTAKMREQIGLHLSGLAYQVTDKLDQGMFERYREFQLISTRRIFGDESISFEEKQRTLDLIQQTYSSYSWIGVTDLRGKVLVATGGLLVGEDVSGRPWFGNALKDIYIGDVHDAKLLASKLPNPTGEPLRFVDVAFPYHDANGKIAGIIGAHLSWKWSEQVQDSVITTSVAESRVDDFILSQDGTVLLGPKAMIGTKLVLPSLTGAQKGHSEFTVERWPDGKDYLVGYSRSRGYQIYPGLGWSVLVRQELSDAFAPVQALQQKVLWSGFGIAFLFSLFGLMTARRITQPLLSLAKAARRLRLGKADTLGEIPASYAEVNELAISMTSLVENLQKEQQALQELNASLEQRVQERTLQLSSSEERLRTITNSLPALIAYVDTEQRYRFCNKTYQAWFGRDIDQIIGSGMREVLGEKLYEQAEPHIRHALQGDRVSYELACPMEKGLKYLKVEYIPDLNEEGVVAGVHVLKHDITDNRNFQAALQQDLLTDALTGLPNRTAYLQRLNLAIPRARRNGQSLAVMFIDVDKFKSINDTYGHEAGDKMLIEFGLRLKSGVRETDTVARLSGDEFVVLIENLIDPAADARLVAEKILSAVRRPMMIEHEELRISTSIGIALPDGQSDTADELLKKADHAMYEAKRAGRNQIMFYGTEAEQIIE